MICFEKHAGSTIKYPDQRGTTRNPTLIHTIQHGSSEDFATGETRNTNIIMDIMIEIIDTIVETKGFGKHGLTQVDSKTQASSTIHDEEQPPYN